jgi:hypothetical protein
MWKSTEREQKERGHVGCKQQVHGMRLSKLIGAQIMTPQAQMLDMGPQDLVLTLLSFSLALVQFFLAVLWFLPFGMGMLTVCHCILEVCNFSLIFQGFRAESLP